MTFASSPSRGRPLILATLALFLIQAAVFDLLLEPRAHTRSSAMSHLILFCAKVVLAFGVFTRSRLARGAVAFLFALDGLAFLLSITTYRPSSLFDLLFPTLALLNLLSAVALLYLRSVGSYFAPLVAAK